MTGDDDDFEAVGVYGDDPLGIMNTGPGDGSNYFRYEHQTRECTCPPPGRWALMVRHDADPFEADPEHQCRAPRTRIDWAEVLDGLKVWRRA